MQIKFDVFWEKDLGTLYKNNSIDTVGKEATVNIDLKQVHNIYANFKTGDKNFTYLVEIIDIDKGLIKIPFRAYVIRTGVNELEVLYIKHSVPVLLPFPVLSLAPELKCTLISKSELLELDLVAILLIMSDTEVPLLQVQS